MKIIYSCKGCDNEWFGNKICPNCGRVSTVYIKREEPSSLHVGENILPEFIEMKETIDDLLLESYRQDQRIAILEKDKDLIKQIRYIINSNQWGTENDGKAIRIQFEELMEKTQ